MTTHDDAVVTVPSSTQILITRVFDAPRHLVYRAYTTPELITRWWAGDRGEVTLVEVDLQVGGAWRYGMLAHGTFEVAFHGVYREIVENERLVHTQVFEMLPDIEALVTNSFVEHDGRTTLTILVDHPTQESRDGHLASGMEEGMNESLRHLRDVARSLA